jgi:endoglucanase
MPGCESTEPSSTPACTAGTEFDGVGCSRPARVAVNTVGYRPTSTKRATVSKAAKEFVVRREGDDGEVLRGKFTGPLTDGTTGESTLFVADFSSLEKAGTYYVEAVGAAGVAPSYPFRIGDDVLDAPLRATMLGMTGLRCGEAVSFKYGEDTFAHGKCHQKDALLDLVGETGKLMDGKGGWHDAGDYGKYVVNGAFSAGLMLKAFEHFPSKLKVREFELPERGGKVPDILDEVRVELEWLFKMQLSTGAVRHKLTGKDFEGFVSPEGDLQSRYVSDWGTAATADFVANLAQASRIYEPYDAEFAKRCLAAAKKSWAFLRKTPERKPDFAGFEQQQYNTGDRDDRVWAAAELWETTGDAEVLAELEKQLAGQGVPLNWDWGDLSMLGIATYLTSSREGRDPELVKSFTEQVISRADAIVLFSDRHPYGLAYGSNPYWGINGVHARMSFVLAVASSLTDDAKQRGSYQRAASAQVDHLLGRNYYARSFVTGVGSDPPQSPHHRPSGSDSVGAPWPGLLIGGPNNHCDEGSPAPSGTLWKDSQDDACTNEIAINWNASLIYALVMVTK